MIIKRLVFIPKNIFLGSVVYVATVVSSQSDPIRWFPEHFVRSRVFRFFVDGGGCGLSGCSLDQMLDEKRARGAPLRHRPFVVRPLPNRLQAMY